MTYIPNKNFPTSAFGELETAENTPEVQILFNYGIVPAQVNTIVVASGTVTTTNSLASVSSGALGTSSAVLESTKVLVYRPGQGGKILFTGLFTTGVAGNTQEIGYGDDVDCLCFGYNGTTFGINRRFNGTDNYVAQTAWNKDKGDGTGTLPVMDWTKGNVFQIKFQYLGFGAIDYFVENPSTGEFILVHRIEYANANITPSLLNPSLPLRISSKNTTNTTNVTVKSASMAGFISGRDVDLSILSSFSSQRTISTESNVMTIRSKSIFGGITNRVKTELIKLSIASESNKIATYRIVKNGTLSGTPVYADVDTSNSPIEATTTAATITGEKELLVIKLAAATGTIIDLKDLEIEMTNGDAVSIMASTQTSNTLGASLAWKDEF